MSRQQVYLIWMVAGIFLFSVALFRFEWFHSNDAAIHLFVIMQTAGLLLISMGLAKLIGFKGWYGVLGLVVIEFGLAICFQAIGKMQIRRTPSELKQFLALVYSRGFMNSVQFDTSVSAFDPKLQYLFKPGEYNFSNLEFSNAFKINSAGFRDDEDALDNPRVVFLGDSYTMGWGVEESESFKSLFEDEMKVSCLNAGISSYGTARERILMDRISLDSCKLLFIQYCSNDLVENYMYSTQGGQLAPENELRKGYDLYSRINVLFKNYFPFKHVYWLFRGGMMYSGFAEWLARFQQQNNAGEKEESIAETAHGLYLGEILRSVREKYHGDIVFYHLDSAYPEDLTTQLAQTTADSALNIHWLDVGKLGLMPNEYFLLDPHINVLGHKKVADALVSFVKEKGISLGLN